MSYTNRQSSYFFFVKKLFIVFFIDAHASIKKRQTYVCEIVEIKTASISRFVTQSLRMTRK